MKKRSVFTKRVLAMVLALTLFLAPATTAEAAVSSGNAMAMGIDVSFHQGAINWPAVAASGVKFAFIRIGSTKSGVDACFAANMQGAQASGIKTGVYIYSYANNVNEAINEANLVISWLGDFAVNMPVVYDIENSNQKVLDSGTIQAMCNAFCQTIDAAGYYPMVYSSKNWFTSKIGNIGYDKWVAQYNTACDYPGALAFWQASSSGQIAGVNTRVDIDYQYKDYSTLIIPTGFLPRADGNVRFYNNYKMVRGWIDFNNTRYYTDAAGNLVRNQWFTDANGTYYFTPTDGSIARGQMAVDGVNYYFDATGARKTGWIPLETGKFYYDPATAAMVKGWFTDPSGIYYLSPEDGHAAVGAVAIDGNNFYFDANGIRQTGWLNLGTGMYYYDPATGAMIKGWFADTKGMHYLDATDGHMVTGLVTIEKNNFLFDANGILQTGKQVIGDAAYFFDQTTGAMTYGLCNSVDGNAYYTGKDGKMVAGLVTINGQQFYFDPTTFAVVRNTQIQVGNVIYVIDANGVAVPLPPAAPAAPAPAATPAK
ncbi:MAG: GH25 family lysozyme [Lachnospiraceae bacterium]|nr:GH25 family lysozyme [Lachnospiraceae bacterium]